MPNNLGEPLYETDDCPNFGQHRYYLAGKTYTEYTIIPGSELFSRTEYAVMACQCGDVKRVVVRNVAH